MHVENKSGFTFVQVSPAGLGLPDRSYYYRGINNHVSEKHKQKYIIFVE
jgi:predicted metalloendopeptidase